MTFITLTSFSQQKSLINVIPEPAQVKLKSGQFTFTPQTAVLLHERNADMKQVAQFFTQHLKIMGGPELQVGQYNPDDKKRPSVILAFPRERIRLDPEGYTLKITPDEIVINATTGAGFFMASKPSCSCCRPITAMPTRQVKSGAFLSPVWR